MSSENQELISALSRHTEAIRALVTSNQQVIALLTAVVASTNDDGDDDGFSSALYLSGTPVNKF